MACINYTVYAARAIVALLTSSNCRTKSLAAVNGIVSKQIVTS